MSWNSYVDSLLACSPAVQRAAIVGYPEGEIWARSEGDRAFKVIFLALFKIADSLLVYPRTLCLTGYSGRTEEAGWIVRRRGVAADQGRRPGERPLRGAACRRRLHLRQEGADRLLRRQDFPRFVCLDPLTSAQLLSSPFTRVATVPTARSARPSPSLPSTSPRPATEAPPAHRHLPLPNFHRVQSVSWF